MTKILAFPKYGDTRNPVLSNLNKHLENDKDIIIYEFSIFKPFTKRYDIFHLHWPDVFFVKSFFFTLLRIIYFLTILGVFKLRGTKLIWTVHNLQPHNNYHPKLNRFVVNIWAKILDNYIVMSEVSRKLIREKYPTLKSKRSELIYHGLYDNYKNEVTKKEARIKLGIDEDRKVLLYFGRIEKYKNIPALVEEINNLDDSYILIIAGNSKEKKLIEQIENKIDHNKNIKTYFRFIEDDEVQFFFNAADLVVLPFKNLLNSGSAMLALSFLKPLYCPNIGTLKELKNIIGKNVINTYEDFTLQNIDIIFLSLRKPNFSILLNFDNQVLSQKLKQFYLKVNVE